MKTTVAKLSPKKLARKKPALPVRMLRGAGATHSPLRYDAEDIEEANRIGEAVCRQHAR